MCVRCVLGHEHTYNVRLYGRILHTVDLRLGINLCVSRMQFTVND